MYSTELQMAEHITITAAKMTKMKHWKFVEKIIIVDLLMTMIRRITMKMAKMVVLKTVAHYPN